jgi:hypothetical protein
MCEYILVNHQSQLFPGGLTQNLFFCISAQLGVDRLQEFNQVSVTPARHRHNEFEHTPSGQGDSLQIGQVVGGQRTWVDQRDDTFDGEPLDDSLDEARIK